MRSDGNLSDYYKEITTILYHPKSKYNLSELEDLIPWETTIHYLIFNDHLEKINE